MPAGETARWRQESDGAISLEVAGRKLAVANERMGRRGGDRFRATGLMNQKGKAVRSRNLASLARNVDMFMKWQERREEHAAKADERLARIEENAGFSVVEASAEKARLLTPRALRVPELHRLPPPRPMVPESLNLDAKEARSDRPSAEGTFFWTSERSFKIINESKLSICRRANAKLALLAHSAITNSVRSSCYECHKGHIQHEASLGRCTLIQAEKDLEALGLLMVVRRRVEGRKENAVNCFLLRTGKSEVVQNSDDPSSKNKTTGRLQNGESDKKTEAQADSFAREAPLPLANSCRAGGENRALSSGKESTKRFVRPVEELTKTPLGKRLAKFLGQSQMAEEGKKSGAEWVRIIRDEANTLADLLDQGERIKASELPTGRACAKFLTKRPAERRSA